MNGRSEVLQTAEQLVNGDRNDDYGPPSQDFARTAAMWAAYFGVPIRAHDVAVALSMVKLSRIRVSPTVRDHWVDLAGYAACGWDTLAESIDSDYR